MRYNNAKEESNKPRTTRIENNRTVIKSKLQKISAAPYREDAPFILVQ